MAVVPPKPKAQKDQDKNGGNKSAEWWAKNWPLAIFGTLLAMIPVALGISALVKSAEGAGSCFAQSTNDLSSGGAPRWTLVARSANGPDGRPAQRQISIALADYIGEPRYGGTFVTVKSTRGDQPLPLKNDVGAFVLGGGFLTDGSQSTGFPVQARATRSPDGRTVNVEVCARRPDERHLSAPGRYKGIVRVAGTQVRGVDIPVQITIKGARTENILLVIIVALLGAILGVANSKNTDWKEGEEEEESRVARWILRPLPFVTGLVAGVLAGLVIYFDDPTFADIRGDDTAKLIVATFAAATGGLTVVAPASRGLRRKLAGKPSSK